ncbi:class I SAM-dependent methyltransferase [Nocardioides marmorisolisilvae]|uniref:Class I SAM-dependent methyltransferase n=1 Tax=Nocardioides marmorisolisilvae TaxID=1542737 RepID=A0A3N0DPH0_9ACTN|nr:class I SAM-dependent methyltransferase [Nocardioides marmorisolisilvae]RNL77532.1 class I SAM-dependent methyltransferase [Nocardioides marmorisolisilvae]
MGFYGDRIVPRIVNLACGTGEMKKYRSRVCAGLHGEVVEVGFGSGLNVAFYPEAVTRVAAVEPSDVGWRLGADNVASTSVPIERAGLDGQRLPFADDSFDTALSTWTLCTIPDGVAALKELRRVLRPGGTLHFVEHGLAPDEKVQRWQHRLNPIERVVAGGCNFNREIPRMITDAGFTMAELDQFYADGPRFAAAFSLGTASA